MTKSRKYLGLTPINSRFKFYLFALKIFVLACAFWPLASQAQEVKLSIGKKSYQVSRLDATTFVAKKDSATLIIMPIDTLSRLVERVRALQEKIRRDSVEIASQRRLIEMYGTYQSAADSNISRQKALIDVTDSIATGYKKLYYDLKSAATLSDYRLHLGFGGWRVDSDLNLYGHLGFGYRDWQFLFNLGFTEKATHSLSIIKTFGF